MDTTYHRFRFLIYVAAFVLILSVCFVYAEPVPPSSHLLFQATPQHSGFLATTSSEPMFNPDDLRAATLPVITPAMLQQLQEATRSKHSLFHRTRHFSIRTDATGASNQSSILKQIPAATE